MAAADPPELRPTTESPTPTPADLKAVIEAERTGLPFVHWRTGAGMQNFCAS